MTETTEARAPSMTMAPGKVEELLEENPMGRWNSNYPEMMEWQTMETAPKTCAETLIAKPFIGYCPERDEPDRISICWWEPKVRGGSWAREGDTTDFAATPVLWMPLPVAPSLSKEALHALLSQQDVKETT